MTKFFKKLKEKTINVGKKGRPIWFLDTYDQNLIVNFGYFRPIYVNFFVKNDQLTEIDRNLLKF